MRSIMVDLSVDLIGQQNDPVPLCPIIGVQDQDVNGHEDPGQGDPEARPADQENPVGVDQESGPAGEAVGHEGGDVGPPGSSTVDKVPHEGAEEGHEQAVGGDDQPDGRGSDTQPFPHEVEGRCNDASSHDGQGGRSEDHP